MRKDSLICFRLSKNLHESLITVAQEDRRSLSSAIEIILTNYLKERKALKSIKKEKRRYPRKAVSVPTFINHISSGEKKLHAGSITDISLNGVRISIPQDVSCEIFNEPDKCRFEIIFTLPNGNRPIQIICESCRVVDSKELIQVGASFIDADFNSYKTLQAYLM
ncbi:MAG: PilZ domain-containing protein [Syntrophaceae bacterium]